MDLTDLYNKSKTCSISDQVSFSRQVDDLNKKRELSFALEKRIAFVSSSTMNGIKESLLSQCSKHNILLDIFVTEYNQFAQAVLDQSSELYAFDPEVVFLHLDTRTLAGDLFLNSNNTNFHIDEWEKETISLMSTLISILTKRGIKTVISSLEVPHISSLGILESSSNGLRQSVRRINLDLMTQCNDNEYLFLFDYDLFLGKIGKIQSFDERLYYLADMRLKPSYLSEFAADLSLYMKAFYVTPKKCLVLDLDNTLWGGVIGESGLDGIQLGPDPKGRSFMEFQQYILSLHNRGIILAINSKNNYDEAINAINNHPHMVLREENFAAIEINWDDKVKNLKSLASEMNIGLDSMVFVDDDEYNREMVKEFLPEVLVVDMPKDFSMYLSTIDSLDCFVTLNLTKEDLKKGIMYAEEKQRKTLKESSTNLTNYLNLLQMKGVFKVDDNQNIKRISQLTQKTNQFNMTTKRYSEQQIEDFILDDNYHVITLDLSDKFGDYGTTGLAIVDCELEYRLDTFLLSCRILGRNAENALMSEIASLIKNKGGKVLLGSFIETDRNQVARDAFEKLGFDKNDDRVYNWKLSLERSYSFPDCIERVD
ncbi:MAG: HAD-IIIC family phosphatase [Gammaproteobacteria bacterium]|nr:HAD-IIIC family phosphatase [Gammaproteobacteria bacterium]